MQYIAHAQRGEYEKCAEKSFDCVMCGVCSARCPAEISHPQVALLARRLTGKYIAPESKHLTQRVHDIETVSYTHLDVYKRQFLLCMRRAVSSQRGTGQAH